VVGEYAVGFRGCSSGFRVRGVRSKGQGAELRVWVVGLEVRGLGLEI